MEFEAPPDLQGNIGVAGIIVISQKIFDDGDGLISVKTSRSRGQLTPHFRMCFALGQASQRFCPGIGNRCQPFELARAIDRPCLATLALPF